MSKKSFYNRLRVEKPCSESWEQMSGTDQIRFCSHSAKSVTDISKVTRKQAMKIVDEANGGICVRYVSDPETKRPLFADRLFQITRRAPGIAAGVMSASIALSSHAYSQSDTKPDDNLPVSERPLIPEPDASLKRILQKQVDTAIDGRGSISGTIVDQQGAVIPGREVVLVDQKTNDLRSVKTDENGDYRFESIPDGVYTIRVNGGSGFAAKQVPNLTITDGNSVHLATDVKLIPNQFVTMGMVSSVPRIEYRNLLILAASRGSVDEIRDLIARGEDVNAKEKDGTTPLSAAVENGDENSVRLLLDLGAKVNVRDKEKRTPLMKLDSDSTPELARMLIDAGADVDAKDEEGNTALIIAGYDAKPDVLKVLIDAGADVNAANKKGETALMRAADRGDIDRVRILVLAGADVNAKDNEGETAWDKTGEDEIEQFLVSHGAIVTIKASDAPDQP